MASTAAVTKARDGIAAILAATRDDWVMGPDLRDRAKALVKKLPPGLPHELVRAFYAQLAEFGPFRPFREGMPAEYFGDYARLRIGRAQDAIGADISEGFVAETAYLFDCRNYEQMLTFAHVRLDEADHRDFVSRQKLVLAHERYLAIGYFKPDAFRALTGEPALLEAARHTLANDWFLARCDEVASGKLKSHRFDIKLWAACKLVLRLAGETVTAPGPG